ncbi:hypothetical protein NE236_22395 [Actinoallomurus purpureus]|uniref:hypothetical protein n=1 Tax=Actinoallomurus purpureus TaxID=478114 RepID=UPI0020937AC1|nr:hypothetical protein [Actinoallomurus purpureus]MCO6007731.1 hypothetical protein [Actinoallomurus purpureus]
MGSHLGRSAEPGDLAGRHLRIAAAWEVPGKAFGALLERYTDDQLEIIADYLHEAAKVGRDQARRLAAEAT